MHATRHRGIQAEFKGPAMPTKRGGKKVLLLKEIFERVSAGTADQ
jgi:hypothetical protein